VDGRRSHSTRHADKPIRDGRSHRRPRPPCRPAPVHLRQSQAEQRPSLLVTDAAGRLLFCGATARGSVPDITEARAAGPVDLLDHSENVRILTDAGSQGLGAQTWGHVITPPLPLHKKRILLTPELAEHRDTIRAVAGLLSHQPHHRPSRPIPALTAAWPASCRTGQPPIPPNMHEVIRA
jgi:hypothetical protein